MSVAAAGELLKIRGSYARTPRENFAPMAFAWLYASFPVVTYVLADSLERLPKNWPMRHVWFWPVFAGVFLGIAGYIAYCAFQRYEFDGRTLRCFRLGGGLAWEEPLATVQSLRPRSNRFLGEYFRITWPHRARSIYAGASLSSKLMRLSSDA